MSDQYIIILERPWSRPPSNITTLHLGDAAAKAAALDAAVGAVQGGNLGPVEVGGVGRQGGGGQPTRRHSGLGVRDRRSPVRHGRGPKEVHVAVLAHAQEALDGREGARLLRPAHLVRGRLDLRVGPVDGITTLEYEERDGVPLL